MPRTVSWLPRLHQIRRSVRDGARTHYSRRDLELLFELGPRMAGKMVGMLDTVQVGPSRLVPRDVLERFLERVSKAEDVPVLYTRLRRKKHESTHKPRAMVLQDSAPEPMPALPNWISLSRGHLAVRFETAEQLAEGLRMLTRMVESHGDEFALQYEPEARGPSAFDRTVMMRGWQARRPQE